MTAEPSSGFLPSSDPSGSVTPGDVVTREGVLGLFRGASRRTRDVQVPDDLRRAYPSLPHHFTVRELVARERDAFEASIVQMRGKGRLAPRMDNLRARLVVLALSDGRGERLLKDSDADVLADWPSALMDALYDAAASLSGIQEGDLEELAGESESAS